MNHFLQYKSSSSLLPFIAISMLVLVCWRVYCYAEIHYTFFGYSIINRKYPEILADAPWRLDEGKSLPIACLVKDANIYPTKLRSIMASYSTPDGEIYRKQILSEKPVRINKHYWHTLAFLDIPKGAVGNIKVNVDMDFTCKGIKRKATSDNLPGLSHKPFNIFVSPYKLPSFDGWYYGDGHYHTHMSHNQVEFGAPLDIASEMGKAIGIQWVIASDHSYDLDRAMGKLFEHDPKLPRWQKLHDDAKIINSKDKEFVVLPAEEVSCGNYKKYNIHLIALNTSQFIPGKGDGVKRGLNKRPDLSLRQCLNRINDQDGFAYAAHPEEGNGYLGKLLLNRDYWRNPDYDQGGYTGLQFWNGYQGKPFRKGYKKWVELLLEGRKLFVLGGNDAHGDFNRCRKVRYPNTKLDETYDHIFGKVRTYANCGGNLSQEGVLEALRNGRTIVTNGPILLIEARRGNHSADIGEEITGKIQEIKIKASSSKEFGPIDRIKLYKGDCVEKVEKVSRVFIPEKDEYELVYKCNINQKNRGYIRAEAFSSARGYKYMCMTNPVWFRIV
ncbi:hypothetical protein GF312_00485 [Candidatus Poribacteria bacterium]|nr:hypothetical protein [Candidatus Poribacteria bacterium]